MSDHLLQPDNSDDQPLLSDLIADAGITLDMPCAGNHTCGKCKVHAEGALTPVSASEAAFLSPEEIAGGLRMACFARALGPVKVQMADASDQKILVEGKAQLAASAPMMDEGHYGVAIDIGTTTVVCSLYSTESTEPLGVECERNAQQGFGADVISRINQGIQHGNEPIHRAIVDQLIAMLDRLCKRAGVSRDLLTHAVVVGNTTMMHFFAGLDPRGIGFVPFIPESLFDSTFTDILPGISAYIPPCVSAYVGADLVSCVLAAQMKKSDASSFIVDIGTNGEMALFHDGQLHACSTAAGPAFEGAGISQGMVAESGAISHVSYDAGSETLHFETIDDAAPRGVCGSGIIDTVASLLEAGSITGSGRMLPDGHPFERCMEDNDGVRFIFPDTTIGVTQADVRSIQLAKAAIAAGIDTLLEACKLTDPEMDVLYICGGFGSFLNLHAAEVIGLLPPNSSDRVVVLGNGALAGAAKVLLDKTCVEQMKDIAGTCDYIELSDSASFMDYYVDAMAFHDDDDE